MRSHIDGRIFRGYDLENDWEDFFEHHFSSPSYHVGWDRTFEAKEDLSDEEPINISTLTDISEFLND